MLRMLKSQFLCKRLLQKKVMRLSSLDCWLITELRFLPITMTLVSTERFNVKIIKSYDYCNLALIPKKSNSSADLNPLLLSHMLLGKTT